MDILWTTTCLYRSEEAALEETKEPENPPEEADPGPPSHANVPQGADPGPPLMEYFEKGQNVAPDARDE